MAGFRPCFLQDCELAERVSQLPKNRINDSISPVPEYTLDIQESNLIILHVREGRFKPYTYKNQAYRRNDSASVPVDQTEYKRLVLLGMNRHFEDPPAQNQNLTFSVLEKEFISKSGIEKLTKDILKTLQLFSEEEGYNRAGELLADTNSFHETDIVRFGETINQLTERETIRKKSILTQYLQAMQQFQRYYRYEK